MIPLVAASDPRVQVFADLRSRGDKAHPELCFVESEIAITRLLRSRAEVLLVLATPDRAARLAALARPGVLVLAMDAAALDALVGFDLHRGCIACAVRPNLEDPAILELVDRSPLRIVAAVTVRDPVNVGALVRTCRALAVDLVVLAQGSADPLSRRAIRAAMGNVFLQPILHVDDVVAFLPRLRKRVRELRVVATTVDPGATPLHPRLASDKLLVLFGNEGEGLPAEVVRVADETVTIPIAAGADSLNVVAASAIVLHGLRP